MHWYSYIFCHLSYSCKVPPRLKCFLAAFVPLLLYHLALNLPWKPEAPPAPALPSHSSSVWAQRSLLAQSPHLSERKHCVRVRGTMGHCRHSETETAARSLTCADEHNIVLSICSSHPVHSKLGGGEVSMTVQEDWPPSSRSYRVKHKRVIPCKLQHIVWKVLCGFKTPKCFTGALEMES